MSPKGDNTFSFSITEVGETTGEKFNWAFTAKKRLSVRDLINKDGQRRGLVGERPQDATQETLMRAEMLAHLSVSITESPLAWRESAGGLDLCDDNVIIKMYEVIREAQVAAQKAVQKEAEEAKEKLRTKIRSTKKDDKADEVAE